MTADVVLCARCGAEQRTDPRILCEPCGTELHGHLRSVREVLALLRDTAARLDRIDRRSGNDDDVRRTLDSRFPLTAAATSSPVAFGATEAGREVRTVVLRWVQRTLDVVLPPDRPMAARYDVFERAGRDPSGWLADRWQLIRRQPWAATCADEVARAVRHAYALVDTPPDTWFAGSCDVVLDDPDHPGTTHLCGWQLEGRLDESVVRCRGCGTQHDVAERRERMLARMPDVLVTAADAARALSTPGRPVTAAMVRGWRHRGHLEPETGPDERPLYNDAGAPLYRLAAVQAADRLVRYGDPNHTRGQRTS